MDGKNQFSLSAPIVRVSLGDLSDIAKLESLKAVFSYWVRADRDNCDLRRLGLLRFRMPPTYVVNTMPGGSSMEQGRWVTTKSQLVRAVRTLTEVVDCVGDQLRGGGDQTGALLAAMLLRHLKTVRRQDLEGDPRWMTDPLSALEVAIAKNLNDRSQVDNPSSYLFAELDRIMQLIRAFSSIEFATDLEMRTASSDASTKAAEVVADEPDSSKQ